MKALWGLSGNETSSRSGVEIKLFQEQNGRIKKENFSKDSALLEDYTCRLQSPRLKSDNQFSSFVGTTNIEAENGPQNMLCHFTTNEQSAFPREKISLNVRGRLYETFPETLARFPNTLLGCLEKRNVFYETRTRQYSFGLRDLSSFDAILFYYQSNGILCRPADVPSQTFYDEICFFQLDESVIKVFIESEGLQIHGNEDVTAAVSRGTRAEIWNILEYPGHSPLAQIFAVSSLLIICLSTVIFCGETVPSVRQNPGIKSIFHFMEICCISWFTLEYLLRLMCSPIRKKFFFSVMGCIDVLAIFPFYIITVAMEVKSDLNHGKICCIFRILKLLRVVRVLKFSRYVHGLNILAQTIRKSARELFLLLLCLLMSSVVFASFAYFADLSEADSEITSIPDGTWFAIISLTCIGYGDIVPVTILGKLNATVCMLSGLVALSIPMPVIVHNFMRLYYNRKKHRISTDYE